VSDRCAKHRHHGISNELLDGPPVAFDLRAEQVVVWAEALSDILWVDGLRILGETDEVAEENRDDLSLLVVVGWMRSRERRAALEAELGAPGILLTARRTGQHEASLGALFPAY
jgi:hypothetical protein